MGTIFDRVVADLMSEPFFADFKVRKRDSMFHLVHNGIRKSVRIHHVFNHVYYFDIEPVYGVRFDVVMKWFEKFSFKPIQIQRDNTTVGFSGNMLGQQDWFVFHKYDDDTQYEEKYKLLRDTIISCATTVFTKFQTLEDYYINKIQPLLDGNTELPWGGADWIFEYLTGCKIVAPENYNRLKEILLRHVEERHARNEPNIMSYYDRMDEILNYLENYDFKV